MWVSLTLVATLAFLSLCSLLRVLEVEELLQLALERRDALGGVVAGAARYGRGEQQWSRWATCTASNEASWSGR